MRGGCRCTKQICNKYANSILLIRLPGEKKSFILIKTNKEYGESFVFGLENRNVISKITLKVSMEHKLQLLSKPKHISLTSMTHFVFY